jgi:phosphate-selective porin OprO/OprP
MIRQLLLGGASALAFAVPLAAQTVSAAAPGSGLDTLVPADTPAPTPPAKTGDAVLDKLNELEAKVDALEARNKELEAQAAETATRVQKVEVRAAKGVQPGIAPTFSDVNDSFTFHPRGTIQLDYAAYNSRAGGYDYNNGTDIRRGRFGFDGTAWKVWKYRIEAEFVKNTVNLLDAYIQYGGFKNVLLTVGQQKAPYGLEANGTDALATFLERGMANTAFGAVGAERRVGATAAYVSNKLIATVGIFGAGEAVQRNATTPDETYGVNGRVTFEPINDVGRLIHVGASGYHVSHFAAKTISNLGDRPNTRVDNGLIESITLAPVTTGAVGNQTRGVQSATYWGTEGALVYGPFSAQGEYNHLTVDRYGFVPNVNFYGYYGFATVFLTGESRSFKGGVVDRVKPFNDFNPAAGHWGAFELAARYDKLDLTDHNLSPLSHVATSVTGGLNWYLNPNFRFIVNYIRFKGTNSPLVVAPVSVNGTTAKGDALATRLQVDF